MLSLLQYKKKKKNYLQSAYFLDEYGFYGGRWQLSYIIINHLLKLAKVAGRLKRELSSYQRYNTSIHIFTGNLVTINGQLDIGIKVKL